MSMSMTLRTLFIVIIYCYHSISNISGWELRPESRTWRGCLSQYEASTLLSLRETNLITAQRQTAASDITDSSQDQNKSQKRRLLRAVSKSNGISKAFGSQSAKQTDTSDSNESKRLEYICTTSIDLGYSKSEIALDQEGIRLHNKDGPSPLLATWNELTEINNKKSLGCYALYDDGSKPWKISTISGKTNIPASLCPPMSSSGAPTLVLGGFTMHRISGDNIDPTVDTKAKLDSVNIYNGARVLDTCLGLGYTAIGAARKVGEKGSVITIEYDDASIEMCSYNPWSQPLFDNSLPIQIMEGDACEIVSKMPSQSFDIVIHDPPARALCRTDLYGIAFYKELRRILRSGGQLFHYIGNPNSKESGRLYSGIIYRLSEAGFKSIEKVESAFGLRALC